MTEKEINEIFQQKLSKIPKTLQVAREVRLSEYDLEDLTLSSVIKYLEDIKSKYGDLEITKNYDYDEDKEYFALEFKNNETKSESFDRIVEEKTKLRIWRFKELKKLHQN